ncbi:ribosomal-protein-serine acetyltransferase [Fictibacillus barbaricus]|uniref:Ribosomal-protein-serine acetyltransferase n=2 Tax=Fictibacillus barbaricus TaxID=182136 RepID=A0ABU1U499_9BACL|nr:ribosomal-protein-serine acetyltransferase [Fictibacillus barbaricus]
MLMWQIDEEVMLKQPDVKESESILMLLDQSRHHLGPWIGWVDYTQTNNEMKQFIKTVNKKMKEQTDVVLFIWCRGQVAGSVALYDLKWHNQSGMLGYWVGAGFEGRGIAHRSVRSMLMYAFYTLGLNRIELRAAVNNERSVNLAQRLGFVQEGIVRQAEWIRGQCRDQVQMSMMKDEFEQRLNYSW